MINNGLNNSMEVKNVDNERVLLVVDALYVGGTETHILSLAKELIKNNVYVSIAARKEGSLISSFEALNCPIHHIDFPRTLTLEKSDEAKLLRKIEDIIESEKISVAHFHQTPSGYLTGKAAKNKRIATVFTVHGTYYPEQEIRMLLKYSDTIICVSPPLCEYIKSFGAKNIKLVPNGIDIEAYSVNRSTEELKKVLKIPKDSVVVLYASRIAWAKANVCSMLLRACKDLKLNPIPDLHLVVVGDGNKLNDIRVLAHYIEKLCKMSFIHIVGEQRDMHAYYSMADCVVGTGRVALEAMASEKTVITAGNHGYFGEVTKDNFDEAWEYYFGDHDSKSQPSRHVLRDSLRRILTDKEYLKQNGLESRKIVEEKFNIKKIAIDIVEIYSEAVKGGNGS